MYIWAFLFFRDVMSDATQYSNNIAKIVWPFDNNNNNNNNNNINIEKVQIAFQQVLINAYWKRCCELTITELKNAGVIPFFITRSISEGKNGGLKMLFQSAIGSKKNGNFDSEINRRK